MTSHKSRVAALVATAAFATLLASCSSSGSSPAASSSSSSSSASTSASASSSASTSSSSSASASPVTAASAAAAAAEQPATGLAETTPLKSKPTAGKTVVWMNCNVDACPPIGLGVKEGAEAVGWKYKQINYSSADPATLVAGMKQALQYHPAYVMVTGVPPEAGWSSVIPAYKAAGVKIIAGTLGAEKLDSTLIANVGSVTLATDAGKVLANWFIADSQGKGQAVLESVNDFPTIALVADSFASSVKANCPGCKVTRLNNTIAQAESGGVVPAIVSTLRSHPSASYIVTPAANLAEGLAAALSGAGLSNKVKWTGYAADPPALTALKSNKAAALIGTPLTYIGWQMMDTALRNTEGMTFVTDPKIPFQLLLPTSSFKVADSEDTPSDYASLFKKLWQVG